MNTNGYNCKNTKDCNQCQTEYNMPHSYCCLDECGEHEFCRGCNHGIYENDSIEMKRKRIEENYE